MSTTSLLAASQLPAGPIIPPHITAFLCYATAPRKGSTHHKPLIIHGYLVGNTTIKPSPRHAEQLPAIPRLSPRITAFPS